MNERITFEERHFLSVGVAALALVAGCGGDNSSESVSEVLSRTVVDGRARRLNDGHQAGCAYTRAA